MALTFKQNFKSTDPKMVSLSVYNVGYQQCEPSHQWGPGVRDHFLIHHVVSGKGYYKVGDSVFTLSAGDSFLVYPYTEITYWADSDDPWKYYWVGFAGSDAALIIHSTAFTRQLPVITLSPENDLKIRKKLLNIYDSRGNTLESSVEMTGALYTALAFYLSISPSTVDENDIQASYVKKATDYIAANYSYPITIEEIADYVGISRSHLFRVFREHLDCSPKDYLTDHRIRQACTLLKNTSLSVTAIALSTGFENNLYFSKAFRKEIGISPSMYRK